MRAVIFERYGPDAIDSMRLVQIEKPVPKAGEVLVRVRATCINSWDWERMLGVPFVNRLSYGLLRPGKTLLGADVAGTVEAVGDGVTRFKTGDAVFGDLSGGGWGGFGEFACAKENELLHKPEAMSFEEAAATPQAGLLALQSLYYGRPVAPGEKVLINGASGGMGSFAVQLARHLGTEVTGTCRTKKMEFVRSLGAEHVIDYTRNDFTLMGGCYDRIIDAQAHHSFQANRNALCAKGVYAFVGGESSLIWPMLFFGAWSTWQGGKKLGLMLHKANARLDELTQLIESGAVRPVIDRVYPIEEAAEAMRYYAQGNTCGKVVLQCVKTNC